MKKKELFNNIIGYDDIKKTLKNIIDVINNEEKYKKLGCDIPHGLMLYGEPGVGKTTFAYEIINSCPTRKCFVIRKNKADGSFINYINNVFNNAVNNGPSIILLDDLDKYSIDDDKDNKEEFVTIQSLMDDVKKKNVFVIATVNNRRVLPYSLLRSGRFDIQIEIEEPDEEDSYKIIEHYLKKKKVDMNINFKNIAFILSGASAASIEKVCNQAGLYAGYNNKDKIEWDELLRASLEYSYDVIIEDMNKEDKYALETAYHEAGHTLISELLNPGSIAYVSILKNEGAISGTTKKHQNKYFSDDIKYKLDAIKVSLAGKAATEIVFNKCDVGTSSDLDKVYKYADNIINDFCSNEFLSRLRNNYKYSQMASEFSDNKVSNLITSNYEEVKKLLISNRNKLDLLANTLVEKKILFEQDIQKLIV